MRTIAFFVCFFAMALPAFAQGVEEHLGVGSLQWDTLQFQTLGTGVGISAEGSLAVARKNAQKRAEEDALKNALANLALVQVDAQKNIGRLMQENETLKAEIERHVREFRVKDLVYYSDGAVKVTVVFSLLKVLPHLLRREADSPPPRPIAVGGADKYTGMVVVASGLPFTPLLSPRIIAEDGTLVYSADFLSGAILGRFAPVAYYDGLDEAKRAERFGRNPLVVRAIRLEGRDTLVVSSNEVRDLLEGKWRANFLEEARVGIVLSGP